MRLDQIPNNGIHIPTGTTLDMAEKEAILVALLDKRCNRAQAAKALGCSIRTLQRKIKYHKLKVPHPLTYKREQQNGETVLRAVPSTSHSNAGSAAAGEACSGL